MLALDRRASVRLQSQTNWRRAAVSFPWRRISGRSMAARPVQHLRQQMSLEARTRGRTRRTLGCYGRPPCPRRRCCGRFVSDLIVSGGRRRNEGAIATVMERRVLTMMGGRIAMMAYRRPQQRTRLSAVSSTAYAARQSRADRVRSCTASCRALLMTTATTTPAHTALKAPISRLIHVSPSPTPSQSPPPAADQTTPAGSAASKATRR